MIILLVKLYKSQLCLVERLPFVCKNPSYFSIFYLVLFYLYCMDAEFIWINVACESKAYWNETDNFFYPRPRIRRVVKWSKAIYSKSLMIFLRKFESWLSCLFLIDLREETLVSVGTKGDYDHSTLASKESYGLKFWKVNLLLPLKKNIEFYQTTL